MLAGRMSEKRVLDRFMTAGTVVYRPIGLFRQTAFGLLLESRHDSRIRESQRWKADRKRS